jgi:hypothetical protein
VEGCGRWLYHFGAWHHDYPSASRRCAAILWACMLPLRAYLSKKIKSAHLNPGLVGAPLTRGHCKAHTHFASPLTLVKDVSAPRVFLCTSLSKSSAGALAMLATNPGGSADARLVFQCDLLGVALRAFWICALLVRKFTFSVQRAMEKLHEPRTEHIRSLAPTISACYCSHRTVQVITVSLWLHFLELLLPFQALPPCNPRLPASFPSRRGAVLSPLSSLILLISLLSDSLAV